MDGHQKATDAKSGPALQKAPPVLRALPLMLLLAGLACAYALELHHYVSLGWLADQRQALLDFVALHSVGAAALFFIVYVAVVALCVPAASVLTIFAGFLFGWLAGGLLVVAAATLGSCLLFAAARSMFGDVLRQRAGPFLARFSEGFSSHAFGYLLVLRLVPLFPFFVVNIAPAFFSVSLRSFAAATLVGIIPGTFVYAWLGRSFEQLIGDAALEGRPLALADFLTPQLTLAFTALAAIAALPLVVQAVRERKAASRAGDD